MSETPVPTEITRDLRLFETLRLLDKSIAPERCKIHLACWNKIEDPLDVYLAGNFDEWQCGQRNKNFERDLVVSLIAMPERHRWLFVGVHSVRACKQMKQGIKYLYSLIRLESTDILSGRLIVSFQRSRASYRNAETCAAAMKVAELLAEPLQIMEFPGYTKAMLTKQELEIVVNQQVASWKAALKNVSGVYVIADRLTGKLYVGSAIGEEGIWGRWCEYAKSGHGGNRDLRKLLRDRGSQYAQNFTFGVLETADSRASDSEIIDRESHWKELLLTRSHGYNAN